MMYSNKSTTFIGVWQSHPVSEQIWILTNILDYILYQNCAKNQLYKSEKSANTPFALIPSIKIILQLAKCEPQLSILDWIFLKLKKVFWLQVIRTVKSQSNQGSSFPRVIDSFTN